MSPPLRTLSAAMTLSCTDEQLAKVVALAGDTAATSICETYNITETGASDAVLMYTLGLAQEVQTGANVSFLLTSAYLVFVMQAGFAMLCAGSVRARNTLNILLKNLVDACVAGICFYLVGYGLAFGGKDPRNGLIGNWDFALSESESMSPVPGYANFMFQWVRVAYRFVLDIDSDS
jgi:ammonium transporter, Amt family